MRYIEFDRCLRCPRVGRVGIACPHARMTGGIPDSCPLPSLPIWRLLEEGEKMQSGDEWYGPRSNEWQQMPPSWIDQEWRSVDMSPVRRRMRGAQAEKPETRVIHTVAIESLLNSTTEFEFECNQIEHDALAKLIEASKANGTGLPLIWVKQTRMVQP